MLWLHVVERYRADSVMDDWVIPRADDPTYCTQKTLEIMVRGTGEDLNKLPPTMVILDTRFEYHQIIAFFEEYQFNDFLEQNYSYLGRIDNRFEVYLR